jgi:5-formyltetrahydrofolate cyclo-ligase
MLAIEKQKKLLRSKIIGIMKSLGEEAKLLQSAQITKKLLAHDKFVRANSIALFASMDHEVNTTEIIKAAFEQKKSVYLPRVISNEEIRLLKVNDFAEFQCLERNSWGIPEPPMQKERELENELNLMILPGVAFDEKRNRLGYGKGYYDRLISWLSKKNARPYLIGIGFADQIVEDIPCDEFDQILDEVITRK